MIQTWNDDFNDLESHADAQKDIRTTEEGLDWSDGVALCSFPIVRCIGETYYHERK